MTIRRSLITNIMNALIAEGEVPAAHETRFGRLLNVWRRNARRCARRSHAALVIGLVVLTASVPTTALAWDGAIAGFSRRFDLTAGSNYDFRVYFVPAVAMCGIANNQWAYLNAVDPNYSAYVAVIMMARSLGHNVTIYSTRDAIGYCHIGYITY
jgi:hypothetical protein